MQQETIVAGIVGIVVGFILAKVTGKRDDKRIVWSEPIDPAKIDPSVLSLIQSGQKIQAIKAYRKLYKVDLKEAKDAVDTLEEHQARKT